VPFCRLTVVDRLNNHWLVGVEAVLPAVLLLCWLAFGHFCSGLVAKLSLLLLGRLSVMPCQPAFCSSSMSCLWCQNVLLLPLLLALTPPTAAAAAAVASTVQKCPSAIYQPNKGQTVLVQVAAGLPAVLLRWWLAPKCQPGR